MNVNAFELLSFHCDILDVPDARTRLLVSAPSSHNDNPGMISGLNPEYCWVVRPTNDIVLR